MLGCMNKASTANGKSTSGFNFHHLPCPLIKKIKYAIKCRSYKSLEIIGFPSGIAIRLVAILK